jgi:hypothetical protein
MQRYAGVSFMCLSIVVALSGTNGASLVCKVISPGSAQHLVAWDGADLQRCNDFATKLSTAVNECPCDDKCSDGVTCATLDGALVLSPAKLSSCKHLASTIEVAVQAWTLQNKVITVEDACVDYVLYVCLSVRVFLTRIRQHVMM